MEAQRTVRPGGGGERLEQRDRVVCVLRVGAVGVSVDSFMVCACEIHRLAVAARPPCALVTRREGHEMRRETGGQN